MATVAVVTGAGRGMGRQCALRLADDADVVVPVDVDEEALATIAAQTAGRARVEPFVADVSDPDAVAGLVEHVASLGQFTGLAHAAGISSTMGDWRRVVEVDLCGSAVLLDAFRPLATDRSAAVCFASSAAHILATRDDPELLAVLDDPRAPELVERLAALDRGPVLGPMEAYAWAKRGVIRLVQRESVSWGAAGARVVAISPGIIDTPQAQQEAVEHPQMKFMLDHTPLGRWGRPEEVAEFVAYLLSPGAGYLTGIDVLIDGGVMAGLGLVGGVPGV